MTRCPEKKCVKFAPIWATNARLASPELRPLPSPPKNRVDPMPCARCSAAREAARLTLSAAARGDAGAAATHARTTLAMVAAKAGEEAARIRARLSRTP